MFPILSILHVCVIDWGSDYVLKAPKEFDPLSPCRMVAPPSLLAGREGVSECCRVAVCQAHSIGSIGL